MKDKEQTKQRLLDAVGAIIAEQGFQGIGINAIAKQAGVDKVLIYRYFSDLDGLLQAFAAQNDYFSNLPTLLGRPRQLSTITDAKTMARDILCGQLRQLLNNKELQEILRWELHQNVPAIEQISQMREEQGLAILHEMQRFFPDQKMDLPAVASLLIGGITYLVLRSRTVNVFNGINLHSEDGWQRIENAIAQLIELLMKTT